MGLKMTASVLLELFLCLSIAGQTPRVEQSSKADDDDVVRITTNLVQVDAVVTDKKGNLITDLSPEDFQVFEDGKPRHISNFNFVLLPGQPNPQSEKRNKTIDKYSGGIPSVPLRPDQVRRTIALVVDDLGMSFESTSNVREELKEYVNQQMLPGDLVAIIRTAGGASALQRFTNDKRLLYAAIDKIRWYPNGHSRLSPFSAITPTSDGPTPFGSSPPPSPTIEGDPQSRLEAFRRDVFAVGTIGTLRYVIHGLQSLPGRKAVVLFSDGIAITDKNITNVSEKNTRYATDATDRTRYAMEMLVQEANRSSVVVYTLDAKGLVYIGLTAEDSVHSVIPDGYSADSDPVENALASRRSELYRGQEGLIFLAHETGGMAITNSNDLSGGLRKIVNDQKGYYLIGYRPEASTFDRKPGGPAFHRINIKVKRPGLKVRSRGGFYGVTDRPIQAMSGSRNQQLLYAMTSPFSESGVNVKLTTLFGNDAEVGSFIRSILHINGSDLTFQDEPDGWKRLVFDVIAVTFGDGEKPVDQIGQTESIRLSPAAFKQITENGFDYNFVVPIKKPGAYQFRTAIRDTVSERLGSASQFVEIPDLKKKRLSISGVMMKGFNENPVFAGSVSKAGSDGVALEAGRISADNPIGASTGTTPGLSATPKPEQYLENPAAGASVRKFKPGMLMNFVYFIYNAGLDKATIRPDLRAQVWIFKDGKPVYTGVPNTVSVPKEADLQRIATGSRIRLANSIEPGDYVLQIVVTDQLAGEKNRSATSWIDFEVAR